MDSDEFTFVSERFNLIKDYSEIKAYEGSALI